MTDIVERAKSALDGVTEGPWELIGGNEYVTGVSICVAPDNGGVTAPDAVFIAASRTLVPELVAEVERLRATLDRVTELAHRWEVATTWDGRRAIFFGEQIKLVMADSQDGATE